jgi:hypothetical protein
LQTVPETVNIPHNRQLSPSECDLCRRPLLPEQNFFVLELAINQGRSSPVNTVEDSQVVIVCDRCEQPVQDRIDEFLGALWDLRAPDTVPGVGASP